MKTAILKNQHYDLEYNLDFLEFAYHCNTVVIPCTPYSPEQKGTVESGIKYLQGNFLPGRTFTDSRDMKRQLKEWVEDYANKRLHGTTRKVPCEEFVNKEASALQSLPEEDFAFFNRGTRTVADNCHVHLENNYYSVPSSLVGKEVTVRWNTKLIRIVFRRIVKHKDFCYLFVSAQTGRYYGSHAGRAGRHCGRIEQPAEETVGISNTQRILSTFIQRRFKILLKSIYFP